MFEAYAVSVTLRINNLVSPQLALLAREFSALESTTLGLIAKLKTLGAESTGLRGVATAMRSVETATERATRSAAQLQTHLAGIRAAAASMPAMGPILGTAGGGGARPTRVLASVPVAVQRIVLAASTAATSTWGPAASASAPWAWVPAMRSFR